MLAQKVCVGGGGGDQMVGRLSCIFLPWTLSAIVLQGVQYHSVRVFLRRLSQCFRLCYRGPAFLGAFSSCTQACHLSFLHRRALGPPSACLSSTGLRLSPGVWRACWSGISPSAYPHRAGPIGQYPSGHLFLAGGSVRTGPVTNIQHTALQGCGFAGCLASGPLSTAGYNGLRIHLVSSVGGGGEAKSNKAGQF